MKFTVTNRQEGVRLSSFLRGTARVSATLLPRLKNGRILVNGVPTHVNYRLHLNDVVEVVLPCVPSVAEALAQGGETRISVLYEDGDLVAIGKPAGMPTHPSAHHMEDSLRTRLLALWSGEFHPVSRLDSNTTGVLLLAKHAYAAAALCGDMKRGQVEKRYLAITERKLPRQEGVLVHDTCPDPLHPSRRRLCEEGDADAKRNETAYRLLGEGNGLYLWECRPITGRTHQIRVQLAAMGCPILGDGVYGTASVRIGRQALHALAVSFCTPSSKERREAVCPIPEDMEKLIRGMALGRECAPFLPMATAICPKEERK